MQSARLLCSATGYDVSNRVEDLAFELKMDILSIALGSAEGFEQADKALHSTSRQHFRLILTAEWNRSANFYDPSESVAFSFLHFSSTNCVGASGASSPVLHYLLVPCQCARTAPHQPLGWANSYEFADADFRVACDTLDSTVDMIAHNRANVKPDKLPWLALRTLLSQCIYGASRYSPRQTVHIKFI
ncbi:hypothetical protein niasHT_005313 [Heterodera trifolii]|uniref:Dynein heavy chain AAA lid domain-containing protein n=1 Tax=Heterodera trifolii TaxID=157864 RepID=A0ABD2M0M0_9BILA